MPKWWPSSTSLPCACSTAGIRSRGDGQQLVIAHDLGQVGDLLGAAHELTALKVVPSIDEAIAAIEASP